MTKEQETGSAPVEKAQSQPTSSSPVAGAVSEKQVRELFRREAQGVIDSELNKALGGISKWRQGIEEQVSVFDSTIAQLTEAGLLKDGADPSGLRQKVVADAMSKPIPLGEELPTEKPKEEPAPSADPGANPNVDPVYQSALTIAEKYGLADGDPELSEIVLDKGPVAYLESVMAAGKKRQARAQSDGEVPADDLVPMETFGTGRAGKKNPIEDITDPDVLLEQGLYG